MFCIYQLEFTISKSQPRNTEVLTVKTIVVRKIWAFTYALAVTARTHKDKSSVTEVHGLYMSEPPFSFQRKTPGCHKLS